MHEPGPPRIPIATPLQVGKYLVSPLTRRDDAGRYTAGVSIRSGRGSMTHDRVFRFAPVFDSQDRATRFAIDHALSWIVGRSPARAPSICQE